MEFLITQYIYPLAEKVTLSGPLGFWLDNPQTELEISVVEDYLRRAYESGYDYRLPACSDEPIVTIEGALMRFRDALSSEDDYVSRVFDTYSREHIFAFLARMWVIARFDDEGMGDRLRAESRKMREEGVHGFFLLDDSDPLITKAEALADFCALLSLLIHSEGEDYFGRQLLIDPQPVDRLRPVQRAWQTFMMFGMASHLYPKIGDSADWMFLPNVRTRISEVVPWLEEAFDGGCQERLLYVGSVLKTAAQHSLDTRTQIVLLTSIIELLLTRNPDFSRYNVEDSISKQFQLKASVLVYLNDRRRDINATKRRLGIIYSLRSSIAHGDFRAVDKYKSGLGKKEGSEEHFDELVTDLYTYIRAIVEEYLKDKMLVEFLKSG
jgi:hypothetical protein